ncbi:hypothetical protein K1719_004550 [Acacia pycnantha]|nr:hypothetical protein K1719_004550 [Acacia pycnantha]
MDFITGLPPIQGHSVIFVIVDRLSKYDHFLPLPANFTSHRVAEVFIQHIVKLHGIPRTIVSDRDKTFTSGFWKHLMKMQGSQLCYTSAYHPQSDGQTEALNKCLELYLRCLVYDHTRQWLSHLPWAEYWYNTSFQTSIGMVPFKVVYGRDAPPVLRHASSDDTPFDVSQQLRQRDELLDTLKANIQRAQARMKIYADKKRTDVEFHIGDFVWVKLQPYRQHSVELRKYQKLALRYFGPFKITERIGKVAYRLALPVILQSRTVQEGEQWVTQLLVEWIGSTLPTWEDATTLSSLYPTLDLGVKVSIDGRGNVTNKNELGQTIEGPVPAATTEGVRPIRKSERIKKPTWKLRELGE